MKNHSCCFTGHRIIDEYSTEEIEKELHKTLSELIQNGVTDYYTGGALGFDTIAAECVLEQKAKNSNITLNLILPCKSQCRGWKKSDIAEYERIKALSDSIVYASEEYSARCMFLRNRMLVDSSDICVCYKTKNNGGTAYTVSYAGKMGKEIINIANI